jgi:hypothetical protein
MTPPLSVELNGDVLTSVFRPVAVVPSPVDRVRIELHLRIAKPAWDPSHRAAHV